MNKKKSIERPNRYSHYFVNPIFEGVNRVFLLSYENEAQRIGYKRYYLPTVEIKSFMING